VGVIRKIEGSRTIVSGDGKRGEPFSHDMGGLAKVYSESASSWVQ